MKDSGLLNRIVSSGTELISDLQPNPDNWRLHPVRQKAATKEAISKVGWVERILVNVRSGDSWPDEQRGVKTVVDGHMRLEIAREAGEIDVPVDYVDLDPSEERYVLATLDPLGALAKTDNSALLAITRNLDETSKSVRAALRASGIDSRESLSILSGTGGSEGRRTDHGDSGGDSNKSEISVAGQATQAREIRYPLAIVLSKQELSLWNSYKERVGIKTDTTAFLKLLRSVVDEQTANAD